MRDDVLATSQHVCMAQGKKQWPVGERGGLQRARHTHRRHNTGRVHASEPDACLRQTQRAPLLGFGPCVVCRRTRQA